MNKRKYPAIGKLPQKMFGVEFQVKSGFQKDNCISQALGGNCRKKSTMEAVNGDHFIRCCSSTACKKLAAKIALGN